MCGASGVRPASAPGSAGLTHRIGCRHDLPMPRAAAATPGSLPKGQSRQPSRQRTCRPVGGPVRGLFFGNHFAVV
jgi:hypothetical protein